VLTAYNTPGHTRGSTTWVTELFDSGKAYKVVFIDGGGFNPGYRVAKDPSYPGIEVDYRNTHHMHELLKPDIWLGHHTEYFDLAGKRKRAETEGPNAWVDPEGYRRFVAGKKRAFEDEVDEELGVRKGAAK
jgi:metallo-beta-lactamase class B